MRVRRRWLIKLYNIIQYNNPYNYKSSLRLSWHASGRPGRLESVTIQRDGIETFALIINPASRRLQYVHIVYIEVLVANLTTDTCLTFSWSSQSSLRVNYPLCLLTNARATGRALSAASTKRQFIPRSFLLSTLFLITVLHGFLSRFIVRRFCSAIKYRDRTELLDRFRHWMRPDDQRTFAPTLSR